jgi:hypothetical protein
MIQFHSLAHLHPARLSGKRNFAFTPSGLTFSLCRWQKKDNYLFCEN